MIVVSWLAWWSNSGTFLNNSREGLKPSLVRKPILRSSLYIWFYSRDQGWGRTRDVLDWLVLKGTIFVPISALCSYTIDESDRALHKEWFEIQIIFDWDSAIFVKMLIFHINGCVSLNNGPIFLRKPLLESSWSIISPLGNRDVQLFIENVHFIEMNMVYLYKPGFECPWVPSYVELDRFLRVIYWFTC